MAVPSEDTHPDLAALTLRQAKLIWRIDALDKWRSEIDGRMAVLESKVNDLTFSDRVAEALATKLEQKRNIEFTIWQKVGAGFVGAVAIAGGIKGLLH